jgi:hypothetical protein
MQIKANEKVAAVGSGVSMGPFPPLLHLWWGAATGRNEMKSIIYHFRLLVLAH